MKLVEIRKKQILDLCKTLLEVYTSYLEREELELINGILNDFNDENISLLEEKLLPIVSKIWQLELASGKYVVISWNKYAKEKEKKALTFATISKNDEVTSFRNLTEGTLYKISFASLIGALDKDGATLIEDASKENEFTIGTIDDKVINSYNGATRLITPYQLVSSNNSDYKSKHNELILKTALIEEVGPYTLDDNVRKGK